MSKKNDVAYEKLTLKIVSILETALKNDEKFSWFKPWKIGEFDLPTNYFSKSEYNGGNIFLLAFFTSMFGFESSYFLTFNQIKKLGGKIKKGSGSFPVLYFTNVLVKADEKNEEEEDYTFPMSKYYNVFNIDDVENVDFSDVLGLKEDTKQIDFKPFPLAQKIWDDWKDKPNYQEKIQQAFYMADTDLINLPYKNSFSSVHNYYSVLFHEAVHSTGHQKRLNRPGIATKKVAKDVNSYSKEELIAELGSSFLCSSCGIDSTLENSIAYLQGWIARLKNDHKLIFSASKLAFEAYECISNKQK